MSDEIKHEWGIALIRHKETVTYTTLISTKRPSMLRTRLYVF